MQSALPQTSQMKLLRWQRQLPQLLPILCKWQPTLLQKLPHKLCLMLFNRLQPLLLHLNRRQPQHQPLPSHPQQQQQLPEQQQGLGRAGLGRQVRGQQLQVALRGRDHPALLRV